MFDHENDQANEPRIRRKDDMKHESNCAEAGDLEERSDTKVRKNSSCIRDKKIQLI